MARRGATQAFRAAVAVLVVVACSSYGANIEGDPVSLAELGDSGGASYQAATLEEIAAESELLLEVEVLDVKRSRFNTADGAFPSLSQVEEYGMSDWNVTTDVDVKVVRVLKSADPTVSVAEGRTFTLTVGGGQVTVLLDPERANAIGVTDDEVLGGGEHVEGDTSPPDIEISRPVTEPVEVTFGYGSGVDLAEGDKVVIFLARVEFDGFGDSPSFTGWVPVHPDGVLYASGDGRWLTDRSSGEAVDVEALALLVGSG